MRRLYVPKKNAIADQLRVLERLAAPHRQRGRPDACHELITKLAEDRFVLAVLGQFKRGKSSLMKSIVGRAVLPTGVVPLTSAITVLRSRTALAAGRGCAACREFEEQQARHIEALVELLQSAENRAAYGESQGLCLRHLGLVLARSSGRVTDLLVREAGRRTRDCAEDLRSFALKTEAIRRSLRRRDEEDAYLRAAVRLVEERVVQAPWRVDGQI